MLKDHLGSTRIVMNSQNQIVSSYDYDAWGNPLNNTVSEESKYRYTGREYDDETGLHNFRARIYDSVLMRFYQVDPAEQFASPYVYCGNNPIVMVDPDGRFSNEIDMAADFGNNRSYNGFECNVYVYNALTKGLGLKDFPKNLWDLPNKDGQESYFIKQDVYYTDIKQAQKVLNRGDVLISGGGEYGTGGHIMVIDEKFEDGSFTVKGAWHPASYDKDGKLKKPERKSGPNKTRFNTIQECLDVCTGNPTFRGLASYNNQEKPINTNLDSEQKIADNRNQFILPKLFYPAEIDALKTGSYKW